MCKLKRGEVSTSDLDKEALDGGCYNFCSFSADVRCITNKSSKRVVVVRYSRVSHEVPQRSSKRFIKVPKHLSSDFNTV